MNYFYRNVHCVINTVVVILLTDTTVMSAIVLLKIPLIFWIISMGQNVSLNISNITIQIKYV